MEFSEIRYEVADGIATITLDRPEKMNAFTVTMMAEIRRAFDLSDADDEVRAVIVTGEGRAFCAGADLSGGANTFDYDKGESALAGSGGAEAGDPELLELLRSLKVGGVFRDTGGMTSLRIFESRKPVIGALNGAAVGIGITMTLPMDIRLASENAKIGFVFNARGIAPEAASSYFLPKLVGISQAAEWMYTGRVFDADEALRGGLVRSVHAPDELLPAARALAAEIRDNTAPVSVALSRAMLWRFLGADHPMAAHRIDSRAVQHTGSLPDAVEGVMSFFEKRSPEWTGKVSTDLPDWYPFWEEPEFS
ncbi:MAG: crotonase/enoyl-CoA hydratase family protein [Actinobacteria bacterium]|nr:crotonase/enoyl-CoA hydratase family protein [Actinomycetota bacterium]